jgi:hypothetical protein
MLFNNIVWFVAGMIVMDILWAYRLGFFDRLISRIRGR